MRNIIELLQIVPKGKSELIDIAKGKHKLPLTIKEVWQRK